jgi:hypothetical protein
MKSSGIYLNQEREKQETWLGAGGWHMAYADLVAAHDVGVRRGLALSV